MAARTTLAAVRLILDTVLEDDSLQQFINDASTIVDDLVTFLSTSGLSAYATTKLEQIERWLAAHLAAHRDQLYTNKSTGGASGGFQVGSLGSGFASTQYGAAALRMDTSGYLAALDKNAQQGKPLVGSVWLGRKTQSDW